MKDIQKALQKARLERQAAAQASERTAPGGSSARPQVPKRGIDYKETRTLSPSNQLLANHRIVAGFNYHEFSDTFRVLRTRILHRLDADGCSTLAVTSAGRGEGKTLTAINLAISLALNVNRTVLLVDVDLRAPQIHRYLGIDASPGLADYLLHGVPLSSCLVTPGVERLVVLPAGQPTQGSSELLSSPPMIELAEELKQRYADRIVVYDLPPVLASDDALAFIHHVERCILVVEDGRTAKRDISRAVDLLEGVSIIGTVLNKSSVKQSNYYYSYR